MQNLAAEARRKGEGGKRDGALTGVGVVGAQVRGERKKMPGYVGADGDGAGGAARKGSQGEAAAAVPEAVLEVRFKQAHSHSTATE